MFTQSIPNTLPVPTYFPQVIKPPIYCAPVFTQVFESTDFFNSISSSPGLQEARLFVDVTEPAVSHSFIPQPRAELELLSPDKVMAPLVISTGKQLICACLVEGLDFPAD